MKYLRKISHILVILLTLICLYAVNLGLRSPKSELQQNFERWLGSINQQIKSGTIPLGEGPSIIVTLLPADTNAAGKTIKLNYDPRPEFQEKFQRLISLVKESNFYSMKQPQSIQAQDLVSLEIKDQTNTFSTQVTAQDLSQNMAAQSFLKLAEIYAAELASTTGTEGGAALNRL